MNQQDKRTSPERLSSFFDFTRSGSPPTVCSTMQDRPRWFAIVIILFAPGFVAAQNGVVNIPENKPRLVLDAGGHSNQVRALAFSADGQRLYSGGMDKTVLGYEITERGKPLRRIDSKLAQRLHWPVGRGLRGAIYELAVSSGEVRRLAIAGFSGYGHGGDIFVYNAGTEQVERVLVDLSRNVATGGLAFSPDGTRLAAVSVFGDTWLWTFPATPRDPNEKTPPREDPPIQLRGAETQDRPWRALTFLDNNTLAVAVPAGAPGADEWALALYDLNRAGAPPRLLRTPRGEFRHRGPVTTIVQDRNSQRWATADKRGAVYLWKGRGDQEPELLRQGREALDVAFGPVGSLFVATRLQRQKDVAGVEASHLEHWKISTREIIDEFVTSTSMDNYACAVSPDLKWVACCGDDRAPVLVFPLRDGKDEFLPNPLQERGQKKLALRGVGSNLGKVAFVARTGTYQIGFGPAEQSGDALGERKTYNNYGSVQQVFDLTQGMLLPEDDKTRRTFRSPDDGSGGWQVTPEREGQRLTLTHPKGYHCTITLDRQDQGEALSYCFLFDNKYTYGLAVGTNHQNGVFIYQIVRNGECPLLRYYRDHANVVTSLSVSPDRNFLASASLDQTIKLWSLDGLRSWDEIAAGKTDSFSGAIAWGASFAIQGDRIVARNVKPAGIAFGRGMREGEVISAVRRIKNKREENAQTPQEILAMLQDATLFEQLTVSVLRNGKSEDLPNVVPAWEPVASLFVDRRDEWAIFTPQGPYEASTNGDQLFGWQFNEGRALKPTFVVAGQHPELEKPDAFREMFAADTRRIYRQIADLASRPFEVRRLVDESPTVQILSPKDSDVLAPGKELTIRAQVTYPPGVVQTDYEITAELNAVDQGAPAVRRTGALSQVVEWRTSDVDAFNHLSVTLRDKPQRPGADFASSTQVPRGERIVHFRATSPQYRPRLHTFIVAADAYTGAIHLPYPVKDADAVVEDLGKRSNAFYDAGKAYRLVNDEITARSVSDEIDKISADLQQDARAGDLLVIFIAGHGVAYDDEYYFVPPDKRLAKGAVANQNFIRSIGVPWKVLMKLSTVRCKKLMMLDTCHSGSAVMQSDVGVQHKRMTRPLRDASILVVSATREGQEAIGTDSGFFTQCVRDGLAGKADGQGDSDNPGANLANREVEALELVHYVKEQVPLRTRAIKSHTPMHSPEALFRSVLIPLTSVTPPAEAQAKKAARREAPLEQPR
jgi:WD40 repeat protein